MARTIGSDGKQTAQAIRDRSLGLFAERGYAAVSMRMIASEVGVQVSALYNYFPTKQALLMDILARHMEQLLAAWDLQKTPPGASALEELDGFARFHIRYHIDKPEKVFLSYMELRSLEPENFAILDAMRQRYERIVVDILARIPVPEPKVTAMAILGMLTGATTWYRPDGRLTAQEIEDLYVRLVRGCIGVDQRELVHV